jgi:hypothetical protein
MAMGLSTHGHFPSTREAWSRVPVEKIKRKKAVRRKHFSGPNFKSFLSTTHRPSLSRAMEKMALPGNMDTNSLLLAKGSPFYIIWKPLSSFSNECLL